MTYLEARERIRTGDVALVKGLRIIRVLTGESYSHVALFVWLEDGLWLFEFVEGMGFQSMPASQWFEKRKGQIVYWGIGPGDLEMRGKLIMRAALGYRSKKPVKRMYGWFSLPVVWLSQVLRRRLPVWLRVCSTFVQECWEEAGYLQFTRTADPGDIAEHCERLTPVIFK